MFSIPHPSARARRKADQERQYITKEIGMSMGKCAKTPIATGMGLVIATGGTCDTGCDKISDAVEMLTAKIKLEEDRDSLLSYVSRQHGKITRIPSCAAPLYDIFQLLITGR